MNSKQFSKKLNELNRAIVEERIDIPDNAIVFLDPALAVEMLTRRRVELLSMLKQHHPKTVQELAILSKRKKQAVSRDLQFLEKHNIIALEKQGREVRPKLEKKVMVVALA